MELRLDARRQLDILSDRYVVERELGGGGVARVFVAEERALGRRVVIKVLPREATESLNAERFQREIQLVARLQHPLIVPVLSAGDAGGLLYYTMPYEEGESLGDRIRREGALPVVDALRLMRDVSAALAAAHAQGVVHRDVKPDNILLSGGFAVVTDFGIARALTAAATRHDITATGVTLGTPAYMAPEQVAADPRADHRVDIYALGVVAYEMLTGIAPFSGPSIQTVMAAHITRTPRALAEIRPAIPATLDALVMRCLAKQPPDRPQSAAEVTHDLEAMLAAEISATGSRGYSGPSARSRRSLRRAAIVSAAGLAAVASGVLWLSSTSKQRRDETSTTDVSAIRSVAVLPFVNSSPDPGNEYFSDGVTEELIDALARSGGLRVPSRSSSFAFKGKGLGARAIGESLHVQTVLEGSVRKAGDRLRITAQLTRVGDGTTLWSERYDRAAGDVFAVQEELASSILGALEATFAGRQLVRYGTSDREAYEMYLRGRYFWNQRAQDGFERAAELFQQAIRRDSLFARAWAGLADSYCILANFGYRSAREVCPRSTVAAKRALALDPGLAEAHASLGFVDLFYEWDLPAAERELTRAAALDSSYANAQLWLAHAAWVRSDTAEMLRRARMAVTLEPLSLILRTRLGVMLWRAGQVDGALAEFRQVFELDSAFRDAHRHHSVLLLDRGNRKEAVAEMEHYESAPWVAYAYARAGRRDDARRLLRELERRASGEYVSPLRLAYTYGALGEMDAAFRWLERAHEVREPDMVFIAVEPFSLPLRRDPRFAAIVRRVKAGSAQ